MVGIKDPFRLDSNALSLLGRRTHDALPVKDGFDTGSISAASGRAIAGEPLDKERSSVLLKSLPLYSPLCKAAIGASSGASTHAATPAMQAPAEGSASVELPDMVVLDTNVVLDWLLFRDPSCAALASHIESRRLRWHATLSMRDELAHVLPRPQLKPWPSEHVLTCFDQWATVSLGEFSALTPRCRDMDDQKFIDLACALGARWLLTRDRALLDLAKPARSHGVEVLTPSAWALRRAAAP
jgi:putative PIN family toxin of toxin-antitoxin system